MDLVIKDAWEKQLSGRQGAGVIYMQGVLEDAVTTEQEAGGS